MNCLASNLAWFALAALLAFMGSFFRLVVVRPKKAILCIAVLLTLLALIGGWQLLGAPPGNEPTVPERLRPGPRPEIPTATLERLLQPWDSESTADWPVAETLATISNLAYLPPVDAHESYAKLGFDKFMPVVAGSMIGYVISVGDVTVIVFRGTDSSDISDWFTNIDVLEDETEFGPVHSGFFAAYTALKPQVVKLLHERRPKRLWITGHSLGGALAVIAAFDLVDHEKWQVDGVITFGQPMIARAKLASHLDAILLGKYARFVNRSDLVARVPPGFAPCGSLVLITDGPPQRSPPKRKLFGAAPTDKPPPTPYAEIKPLTPEEFEAKKAQLRLAPRARGLPPEMRAFEMSFSPIDNHSMDLYLKEIRKLIGVMETGLLP